MATKLQPLQDALKRWVRAKQQSCPQVVDNLQVVGGGEAQVVHAGGHLAVLGTREVCLGILRHVARTLNFGMCRSETNHQSQSHGLREVASQSTYSQSHSADVDPAPPDTSQNMTKNSEEELCCLHKISLGIRQAAWA